MLGAAKNFFATETTAIQRCKNRREEISKMAFSEETGGTIPQLPNKYGRNPEQLLRSEMGGGSRVGRWGV